jgi:hypothetical protein
VLGNNFFDMSVGISKPSQRSGCDLSKLNVGFVRQQIAIASDCVGLVIEGKLATI